MFDVSEFEKIVVITGAGISAPSGLPTYRGKDDSLWNDEDFMNKSTIDYIKKNATNIDELWSYWGPFREKLALVEPNAAHKALAYAEQKHYVTIGTQNVDGLHQKAGSTNVQELHGSLFRDRCLWEIADICERDTWEAGTLTECRNCGGSIRPDVVLFGEYLPFNVVAAVERAVLNSDLVIYVGTSGIVYPVAGYVDVANKWHKKTLLVNDQEWDHPHPGFNEKIFGPCEEILPELFGL